MTDQTNDSPAITLSTAWRVVISIALVIHIVAVLCPPFMLQASGSGGTSPAGEMVTRRLSWYIDFGYLNHGYAFFAPNPGPSHLIDAEIEFDDGRDPITLRYPDLEKQWPRLLYHRHFMLSEQLNADYQPPQLPPEISQEPELAEGWQRARHRYDTKWHSYEEHLRSKHNAFDVTLSRVQHRMIDVFEVGEQNKPLDDPDTYIDLPEDGIIQQEGFSGGVP